MTVQEVLKKYEGKNVKIGASSGTCFIYCGIVRPGLYDWLKDKTASSYVRMKELCDQWEWRYKNVDGYILELGYYADEEERNHLHDMAKAKYEKYKDMLSKFRDINSSQVVEEYNSILEDDVAKIIIFDGVAKGTFWTIAECDCMPSIKKDIERYEYRRALRGD